MPFLLVGNDAPYVPSVIADLIIAILVNVSSIIVSAFMRNRVPCMLQEKFEIYLLENSI
jgi:hypothetical protein